MSTDQKLVAAVIAAGFVFLTSVVAYNFWEASNRKQAYRECLTLVQKIADNPQAEGRSTLPLPTCYFR